jgi:hypothetical protein
MAVSLGQATSSPIALRDRPAPGTRSVLVCGRTTGGAGPIYRSCFRYPVCGLRPLHTISLGISRGLCIIEPTPATMFPMTCTDLVPSVERVAALVTPVDGRMITFTSEKPRHKRVEIAG